ADVHFAPTNACKSNLLREGVPEDSIYVTGNTVIDALRATVSEAYEFHNPILREMSFTERVLVVEVHRRENWGEPMRQMSLAIADILEEFPDCQVIFPVHLNPVVRDVVYPLLSGQDRITLLDPLDTDDFHNLMARSHLVLTDSGGLQEEAPSLGIPVLVMRNNTERPEAVEAGTVKLVGTERLGIVAAAAELLANKATYQAMAKAVNPYGDGNASVRVAEGLLHYLGKTTTRPGEWRY
ncbi:MAG: UDP-N-acetylglucosamine 2-epimerase (non-hydrolyzing), partial [Bacillota bacterium]|nr:UDP-N-acetylglucosamine 2-epimerase (non-hydrolyzing) [Bacillota bacterium]